MRKIQFQTSSIKNIFWLIWRLKISHVPENEKFKSANFYLPKLLFKMLPNSPVCLTTKKDKGWGLTLCFLHSSFLNPRGTREIWKSKTVLLTVKADVFKRKIPNEPKQKPQNYSTHAIKQTSFSV